MRRVVAVLMSGGVDSCVLAAELARRGPRVVPLYVRCGLRWERAELDHLRRFCRAVGLPGPVVLSVPVRDVYSGHWSLGGGRPPGARTRARSVELPGRNILLLSTCAVYCARNRIGALALGTLKGNPFADATPVFFHALRKALARGLGRPLAFLIPYSRLKKQQVIRRGRRLPLKLTFSCLAPVGGRQCGRCNKCAERRAGFRRAGVRDLTPYAA